MLIKNIRRNIFPMIVAIFSIIGTGFMLALVYKTDGIVKGITEPQWSYYYSEILPMLETLKELKFAFWIALITGIIMLVTATLSLFKHDKRLSLLLLVSALTLAIVSAIALKTLTTSNYSFEKYIGGRHIANHYATNPLKPILVGLQVFSIVATIPVAIQQSMILTTGSQSISRKNMFLQCAIIAAISIIILAIVTILVARILAQYIDFSRGESHPEEATPFVTQNTLVLITVVCALILSIIILVLSLLLYKKPRAHLVPLLNLFQSALTYTLTSIVVIGFCVSIIRWGNVYQVLPIFETITLLIAQFLCTYILFILRCDAQQGNNSKLAITKKE